MLSAVIALCCICCSFGNDMLLNEDFQRIFYYKYGQSNAPSRFLVLEKTDSSGNLVCHYLGSSRRIAVKPSHTVKLDFYETSPVFMISQSAIYNFAHQQKNNLPLQLAKTLHDPHGRMLKFSEFENAARQFRKELRRITRNRSADVEQEDKIDAVYLLLEKTPLTEIIRSTAAAQDWVLALAMYRNLSTIMLLPLAKAFPGSAILDDVRKIIADCENELCTALLRQLKQSNVRREQFKKHYPQAGGLWNELPPADYQGIKKLFERSMQSYFNLDKISRLTEPQEWGSAVLDVLLLLEGTPAAAELEKEFDSEMRRLEKSAKQQ